MPQLSQNKGQVRFFKGWGVPQGEGPATHRAVEIEWFESQAVQRVQ